MDPERRNTELEAALAAKHAATIAQDVRIAERDVRIAELDVRMAARAVAAKLDDVSGSCGDILWHKPALWNFVEHAGVEPTNNHAERVALCHGMLHCPTRRHPDTFVICDHVITASSGSSG